MPSTDIQTDRKNLLNVEQNVHFPFFFKSYCKNSFSLTCFYICTVNNFKFPNIKESNIILYI